MPQLLAPKPYGVDFAFVCRDTQQSPAMIVKPGRVILVRGRVDARLPMLQVTPHHETNPNPHVFPRPEGGHEIFSGFSRNVPFYAL